MADKETFLTPEGRVTNQHLFKRDIYVDDKGNEGKPRYTLEMVFDPEQLQGKEETTDIENKVIDALVEEFGSDMEDKWFDEPDLFQGPWISGDDYADDRESRNKAADAYRGKLIIRMDTQYNKHGDADEGGAEVYDEEGEAIEMMEKSQVYAGCFGMAAVNIGVYKTSNKKGKGPQYGVKFYLKAFGKTKDGERFSTGGDNSSLFKKPGREGGSTRRSRKG